jgi:small subunit ribosomal protein S6
MAAYESIFILRPDLDDETVAKMCDRIGALIVANNGTIVAMEKMGPRHLSYEVKGYNDGYYVVLNYEGQTAATSELERVYKISDEVIRYIIVKRETPFKSALGREPAKEGASQEAGKDAPGEPAQETGPAPGETPKDAAPPTDGTSSQSPAETPSEATPIKADATPEA